MRELRGEHDRERIRVYRGYRPAQRADREAPTQQPRCADACNESGREPEHHDFGQHAGRPQDSDRETAVTVVLQMQGEEHIEGAKSGLRQQCDEQESTYARALPQMSCIGGGGDVIGRAIVAMRPRRQ